MQANQRFKMTEAIIQNPAEQAGEEALNKVYGCIDDRKNFILEAGAGAGKTYSLIYSLSYLIKKEGIALLRRNQKIACITFTNIAKDQIDTRTDRHPVIYSDTIHGFCWSLIRGFQDDLRHELPSIGKWPEKLVDIEIGKREIVYDLGYPSIGEDSIELYHDDVLDLMVLLLAKLKFRKLITDHYPILFIDEYQDTYQKFAEALKVNFLDLGEGPLIGFFGDHWQKIYGNGCGKIEHPCLIHIDKNSNFRSVSTIVNVLNQMRPELPQNVKDPNATGMAVVYHTNAWVGTRRNESHWKDDLPSDIAHTYLNKLKEELTSKGWDFSPQNTKILMLTHNILADEQGYRNFANVFDHNETFIKKEDKHVAFFVDVLEPLCSAYENKKYGEMFALLGSGKPGINSPADKSEWIRNMNELIGLRNDQSIGRVIAFLREKKRPRIPDAVERKELDFEEFVLNPDVDEPSSITRLRKMKEVPYKEVIAFAQFSNEHTPFATKHSVKGAEFENVLVVIGRGWNQYNFGQMLEWAGSRIPPGKDETFQRSRNLFYVVCSRPKKRLALLFTQKLSATALAVLSEWFGAAMVYSLTTS